MVEPSQKVLIHRILDWHLLERRLRRYASIQRAFTIDDLEACKEKPPYFCHYLAWRLGTWTDESWFEFFDTLLARAMRMPAWTKRRVPKGCDFGNFWAFVWELEVAAFFAELTSPSDIEWQTSGPDLKVGVDGACFFVECTTYHKSFGLEQFINSLLGHVDPNLRAVHTPCLKFSLPNIDIAGFLDQLLQPLLDPDFLRLKSTEAKLQSPVLLPVPTEAQNLYLYMEDVAAKSLSPHQPWATAGDPEAFLQVALREVIEGKAAQNNLANSRPNLLAVSYLLSRDFQLATALRPLPAVHIGPALDGVLITACGIDQLPSIDSSFIHLTADHPAVPLLTPT